MINSMSGMGVSAVTGCQRSTRVSKHQIRLGAVGPSTQHRMRVPSRLSTTPEITMLGLPGLLGTSGTISCSPVWESSNSISESPPSRFQVSTSSRP